MSKVTITLNVQVTYELVLTVIFSTVQTLPSLATRSASALRLPSLPCSRTKNSSKSTISLVSGSVAWKMKLELWEEQDTCHYCQSMHMVCGLTRCHLNGLHSSPLGYSDLTHWQGFYEEEREGEGGRGSE